MNEIDYILELLKSESMKPEQLGIPGSSIAYQILDDDQEPHTIDNTLKRIHLIAARELIKIDLMNI